MIQVFSWKQKQCLRIYINRRRIRASSSALKHYSFYLTKTHQVRHLENGLHLDHAVLINWFLNFSDQFIHCKRNKRDYMGKKPSKFATSAPSSGTTQAFVHPANDNKVQIEEIRVFVDNIQAVLDKMHREVEANSLLPNRIFEPLFGALTSLQEILKPSRPNICYIVGPSNTGKSSTINKICGKLVCPISDNHHPGTTEFQVVEVPEVNTTFVDTIGFGSNKESDQYLLKEMRKLAKQGKQPDAIVLVITKDLLRRQIHLKNTIKDLNTYLTWLKNQRGNTEVPVFCILGKIDEYFKGQLPSTADDLQKVNGYIKDTLEIVNEYLIYPATSCISISAERDYGIETLRNNINAHSPFSAQIIDRNLDYFSRARKSLANKIIATFATASAAASLFPLIDIVIVTFLQQWMYRMLACFSINPSRTPESFKTLHGAQQLSSLGIRAVALLVGGVFQLSFVGYVVGSAICTVAASSSTAVMGWACYHYFIQ